MGLLPDVLERVGSGGAEAMQVTSEQGTEIPPNESLIGRPDRDHVQQCLGNIFASAEFVRSERMISFLRFVVDYSLDGRQHLLTERLIGQKVFARAYDWDPSLDTIVRSEARRLRSKLDHYYDGLGQRDAIEIRVPRGRYIPEFIVRDTVVSKQIAPPPQLACGHSSFPLPETASSDRKATRYLLLSIGLSCGLAVLAVAVAIKLSIHSKGEQHPFSRPFQVTLFTSDFGREFSPAISPDGHEVAYVWDDGISGPDIFLRKTDGGSPVRLCSRRAIRLFPSWSHSGRQIAYLEVKSDTVAVMTHSLSDGREREITEIRKELGEWPEDNSPLLGPPGPIWTANDKALIVADRDRIEARGGLFLVDAQDGARRAITETRGEIHDLYPRLSADGKNLAYVRYSSHGVGELFVQSLGSSGSARQLTHDSKAIQGIAWIPDGRHLLFASNRTGNFQLWSVALADDSIASVATNTLWATEPSVAPSGAWLLYVQSTNNWNIWRRPADGSRDSIAQRLISSSGRNYDPRYSPNGDRIAFASDRSGNMELWVGDSDGRNARQLTYLHCNWLGGINWSPDGTKIAFDARPEDHSVIYIVPSVGGEAHPLDRNRFEERMPNWSADGRSIYFNSNRDGTVAIFSRSLIDGSLSLVSPPGMFAVAAMKSQIIYSSRSGELFQSNLTGQSFEPLQKNLRADPVMSWMPSGHSLYLSTFDPILHQFRFLRYSGGRTISLGILEGSLVPNAPDIAISPDEKYVLYSRQESTQDELMIRRGQP